jgi:hypothetical protein
LSAIGDKLWIWGHDTGSHNREWKLPRPSSIPPADAAEYMGILNVVMVVYGGEPHPPFADYAMQFRPMKQVVWSIIGDASSKRNEEQSDLDAVMDLSATLPNVTGAIMDDIFLEKPDETGRFSRVTVEQLAQFRDRLHGAPRPLDLWAVLYSHDLKHPIREYMDLCDVITYWTWNSRDLVHLEESFAHMDAALPDKRKVLGCYMYDYGVLGPMPVERMQHQCELGLRWLQEGRIEGMIFLASCICDIGLEAVEWTKRWIAALGDE